MPPEVETVSRVSKAAKRREKAAAKTRSLTDSVKIADAKSTTSSAAVEFKKLDAVLTERNLTMHKVHILISIHIIHRCRFPPMVIASTHQFYTNSKSVTALHASGRQQKGSRPPNPLPTQSRVLGVLDRLLPPSSEHRRKNSFPFCAVKTQVCCSLLPLFTFMIYRFN